MNKIIFAVVCICAVSAFAAAGDVSTTDLVVQKWAERKYESSDSCDYDKFVDEATRTTEAIGAQIFKKAAANYNAKNWFEALKACGSDPDSMNCFLGADWVLSEEMQKTANKYGCKPKDLRTETVEAACRPGHFKSSTTAVDGVAVSLCSMETKCARSSLFEEGSYNIKCKAPAEKCGTLSLKNCQIFRFESIGWISNTPLPQMQSDSTK